MATVTVAALMTRVRQYADRVGDQFVTDTELQDMVCQYSKELYDKLVGKGRYNPATGQILLVAGQSFYNLDLKFYRLLAARVGPYGGGSVPPYAFGGGSPVCDIESLRDHDVAIYRSLTAQSVAPTCAQAFKYRLGGVDPVNPAFGFTRVEIFPQPRVSTTWILEYDFIPTAFLSNAETADPTTIVLDGIDGWDAYITWQCVRQILAKDESDTSFADGQLSIQTQRIEELADARDSGHAERIQPQQRIAGRHRRGGWPYGFGGGS